MAVFSAKQNSAAKATFLCNFLFLPEKESWRKITTFAPAMDRSRTYNPATSRRAFPSPPAQAHVPASRTQRFGSNQKPIANGQRPIAKIQHPTPNPQFPTPRWMHTFSAKERDSETGLSYFGSRYYSSDLSIWLSVDPMSDKYASLSPYTYCANNPVKLVDPNGEEVGNYYDLNGNYLGNDKIDDGKIYVVIETPTGNTSVNPRDQYDEKNIFQVPSFEKRKEIVDKLEDFDRQRPNAEWGGVCGVGINPNNDMYEVEKVVWGNPSQDGNPSNSERLGYRQLNMKEIGINGFCVFFDYHSHGSGGWIQKPSNWFDSEAGIWRGDIPNVTQRLQVSSGSRTFAVFAMEEKNVYFYTDKGVCGKMDFNTFRNLGQ